MYYTLQSVLVKYLYLSCLLKISPPDTASASIASQSENTYDSQPCVFMASVSRVCWHCSIHLRKDLGYLPPMEGAVHNSHFDKSLKIP